MGMTEDQLRKQGIDPNAPVTFADILTTAQQTPIGTATSDYAAVEATFGTQALAAQQKTILGLGGFAPAPTTQRPALDTGWIRMPNGVFANPTLGQVLFPTPAEGFDPSEIPGSEQWLRSIQDTWSETQFDTWRKRLIRLGYDTLVTGGIAEKGGKALDIIEGLRQYHFMRYLNGGKAIPATPVNQKTREAMREQIDFVSLKERVKPWGTAVFGEDLDDDSAEWIADKIVMEMTQLARKHPTWTFEQIESGADVRVQKEFLKEPEVKEGLKEVRRIEERTGLRDKLETAAQVFGSL